jgi:peptidoglycan/xylan/chitin deacetylase (PgdA/CDA1 family)
MICVTGDIHHTSLKINEQRFITEPGDSEAAVAARYLRFAEEMGVKLTFYATGRTLREEWRTFEPIARSPLVEIGGHTYNGLPRTLPSRLRELVTGIPGVSHSNSHGSYRRQRRDVERMIAVARERTGRQLLSWRSHGLVRDANTYRILHELGIRFISDDLDWNKSRPERLAEGLISHPMNVIMDHDHIYHAHRTPEYVERQKRNWGFSDDPTRESYPIEEWRRIVERQVQAIEAAGGLATVLMHPLCMYVADRFVTARRLLEFFSRYRTIWAREAGLLLS